MNIRIQDLGHRLAIFGLLCFSLFIGSAQAAIDGVTGTTFNFTAKPAIIPTPDGDSLLVWGYGLDGGPMQYPGPTLIVNQGDEITINLTNDLNVPDMPVSLVFPGMEGVTASGGTAGELTQESNAADDTVTYTFTASHPGTFQYHSGTRPDLQIEMGMVGAIIVRPATPGQAYNHPGTAFDQEYLFVLTEMAPEVHYLASLGLFDVIEENTYESVLWFINGRNAPDTMAAPNVSWLPNQPYNALPRTHVGETVLLRVIGAGQDLHPFHVHGNHAKVIARDGRLQESAPGAGPDLARVDFTIKTIPGGTYDALWTWTGEQLGWDIFGHDPDDPLEPNEYAPDHGKPMPVTLPGQQDMTFGGFYSGSPYLGQFGDLPPGEGGLNLNGGLFFMWHSHTERELVNNDIFPGGMMTMMIVEPNGVPID
ncbi:MAG: multicopper oxidase domain-containing protein [Pseudomonadota bacterium]